jgi:hypothetical protein
MPQQPAQVAPQGVQPEARQVELFRPHRLVEPCQHAGDLVASPGFNSRRPPSFAKATKAAILKAPDHLGNIYDRDMSNGLSRGALGGVIAASRVRTVDVKSAFDQLSAAAEIGILKRGARSHQ